MMKKTRKCPILGNSVKERLVKAAFDLMAEKGIENVSVREIVAKVKVTKPVLYYYFKNKEDLCRYLFDKNMEHFQQILDDASRKGGDLKTLFIALFTSHYQVVTASPKIARMLMHAISSNEKKSRFSVMMQELRISNRALLRTAIAHALKKEGIPASCINDVFHIIGSFMAHVLISTIVEPETCKDEDLPRRMAIILADGIKAAYKPAGAC